MASCDSLPPNSIFLGCCPQPGLRWVHFSSAIQGWCDLSTTGQGSRGTGYPFFQPANETKLWRTFTQTINHYERLPGTQKGAFIAGRIVRQTFAPVMALLPDLNPGSCSDNSPAVEYLPNEAAWNAAGGESGLASLFTTLSATRCVRTTSPDDSVGRISDIITEVSDPIEQGEITAMVQRKESVMESILASAPNRQEILRTRAKTLPQNVFSALCDWSGRWGGVALNAPRWHSVERAFYHLLQPRPLPDSRGNPGMAEFAFWEAYKANIYMGLADGTNYCEVTRLDPPMDPEFVTALDLTGGTQLNCVRKISNGSITVKAPEPEKGHYIVVDLYVPETFHSPPTCCGMAP
jgi:hypothetical protein